jgi:hypothetical protein
MLHKGMSPTEAARLLRVDCTQVYQAMQKGHLVARKVDGRCSISYGSIQDYRARKMLDSNSYQ